MLELILLGGFAAYNLATTHSDTHESVQGSRKINCYEIWDQITHGQGPQSIADAQAAAGRLKSTYQDRLTTIDDLAKEMDAAWTGAGAEAAQQAGAHPLRVWMADSGTKLGDSDKYLGDQHNAFTTVHTQVQEVPQNPPKNNLLNALTPWTTDTDRAIRDYNTKGQANVDAFNAYFKASNDNGQKMPVYAAVQGQKEPVDVKPDPKDGGKKPPDRGKGGGPGDGGPGDGGPGNGGPGGHGPGSIGVPPGGPGGPGSRVPGVGQTPPPPRFDVPKVPVPSTPPGGYTPPNIPTYSPPSWNDGTQSAGFTPPSVPGIDAPPGGSFGPGGSGGFSVPGGGGGGFGPGGSGGAIAPGFGPGGGSFGPGTSTGAAMPGGAAGAGAGAGAAGAGAGAGGAAAANTRPSGMSGMGGMGHGARGHGGGDEERSSKYLVSEDPNDLFGTDELTAPPVIGE